MVLPTPLQAFSGMPKASATTEKQTIVDGEKMTGAEALVRSLEDLDVKDVFGVPGGAILPVYDSIKDDTKFRFVLMRHEQAAGHAAEGYALTTGQVGVCIVTSGPGATNMITPIADANMDSIPMVVITGQVGVNAIGTDAFQEADIVGATYPVVKHSYLVTRAQDIPRVLTEAHYIARSGRPGPVVVDVTKTAQTGEMYYSWPQRMILPGYNPTTKAHGRVLSDAAKLFEQSYRPVLYVGGGAVRSDAGELVKELADVTGAPIVTTLPARGIVPDSDPKVLGMLGMHGTIAATGAVQRCDLLVAIGARFDDRVTGKLDAFAPGARVIHIDIDPAEIGKNRQPDVPIVGDVATVLKDLIPEIKREQAVHGKPDTSHWWDVINKWVEDYPITWDEPTDGSLAPQWVVKQLSDMADPDTIWVSGVGQHQMWATQIIEFNKPHSWLSSGGLGTMGFGLPAAIGARVGIRPRIRRQEAGVAHRRRRLLPDDFRRVGGRVPRPRAGEDRPAQQLRVRHGPPVADPVLRASLFRHEPAGRREYAGYRGCAGLREARRSVRLRGHARVHQGRGHRMHQEGQRDQRPSGADRLPRVEGRHGVADGRSRRLQRQRHLHARCQASAARRRERLNE